MMIKRCAVYTRKSTEDGLELEFNSLDAQREACEAFILSQKHEGWTLIPSRYDDGGFSGGSMERPGLKALLADVDAGLIDVIVVYKVDRLTRSLADFAKIVERLDAKGASFVSVTQAFNTTTSMGRLTLNVLLSFAQFEREVTGERIRDKIAASKRKGLWMGGPVPLGYKVVERKLVTVPEEAERVRTIMRRYVEIGSVPVLLEQLKAEDLLTKVQVFSSTVHRGGIPFARGSLFHLLKNPIYRGKIVHKGQVFDGEHEAIVDEDLWEQVQMRLQERAPARKRPTNEPQRALLQGMMFDPEGRPMVPTYGSNGTRRYTYYVSRKDLARKGDPRPTRFRRGEIENHITSQLIVLLKDDHALRRMSGANEAEALQAMFDRGLWLAQDLARPGRAEDALRGLVNAIHVTKDAIRIELKPEALGFGDPNTWSCTIPRPTGGRPFREAKLRMDAKAQNDRYDADLVSLFAEAMEVQRLVLQSPELSLNQLGKREGRCRTHLARLLRISWLSPRIVEAVTAGTQPKTVTRKALLSADIPLAWDEQERMLGLAA
ncbi:MAG: recombinase family protein [Sphingomonadales bacterium]|jgi:DNA invertase Pin-like site-specific DNA recombinase